MQYITSTIIGIKDGDVKMHQKWPSVEEMADKLDRNKIIFFRMRPAGTTFIEDYDDIHCKIKHNKLQRSYRSPKVIMIRDKNNEYDENAIRVVIKNRLRLDRFIGFVPRDLAGNGLAMLMDSGDIDITGKIVDTVGGKWLCGKCRNYNDLVNDECTICGDPVEDAAKTFDNRNFVIAVEIRSAVSTEKESDE